MYVYATLIRGSSIIVASDNPPVGMTSPTLPLGSTKKTLLLTARVEEPHERGMAAFGPLL